MRFREILESRGLADYIQAYKLEKVLPYGARKFIDAIGLIVERNYRVFIDPDCDPDGYFAALTIKEMFDIIGYTNYVVGRHSYKRHTLTVQYARDICAQHFDVVIIMDSGSGSMDVIQEICSCAKLGIIVDHHRTTYKFPDYPNNMIIINPWIENNVKTTRVIYDELSACALASLLVDATLAMKFKDKYDTMYKNHFIYGYITLYSDSCKFNPYCIAYAKQFKGIQFNLPRIVKFFMAEYDSLYKNFISYRMIPRINALLRNEYFDLVWQLFFDFDSFEKIPDIRDTVETIYKSSKEYVMLLEGESNYTELSSVIVAYLPENCEPKARNFTGLVANDMCSRYRKPCICLFNENPATFTGSVRDLFNRDLLTIFSQLCYAEGHDPAFGISVKKLELDSVLDIVNDMISDLNESYSDVIIIDWNEYTGTTEELKADISAMAEYNEYAGQGTPNAFGLIKVNSEMRSYPGRAVNKFLWRGMYLTLIGKTAERGDTLLVEPCMSNKTELIVKSVGTNRAERGH